LWSVRQQHVSYGWLEAVPIARKALVVALLTNRVYYGRDPTGIAHLRPELHDAVIEAIR
jgi:hypothetical protein